MDRIAAFIANTDWGDLPAEVRNKAILCAMDDFAAILAGRDAPVSQITASYAAVGWPGSEATIISNGAKAAAMGAAFANAYAANALDIDDCGLYTKGHPGAQLFPTALAIAEKQGLSGRDLLTSLVIGYEIAHRIGRCWHDYHSLFHGCGSWGSVACAAVAARLLELKEDEIKQSLGIAEYHAPLIPMMRDARSPSMAKHGIGIGPLNGILAAELAARGFTAPESVFSWDKYRDWVEDIGSEHIMLGGIYWKEYSCCAWVHPALDAVRKLREQHGFQVDEIDRIVVKTFHEATELGVNLPATTEEAQFNVAWPIAAFLVDGKVGPRQINERYLSKREIRELAQRVEIAESSEFTEAYRKSEKMASEVTIFTLSGAKFSAKGNIEYPQTGYDKKKVEQKFLWLVGRVYGEQKTKELLELVVALDELSDVRDFMAKAVVTS